MHTLHGKKFFTAFRRNQSLGLLFTTSFCETFFLLHGVTVARYVDDTTSYKANKTNDLVIREIVHFSKVLFQWFDAN